MYINIIKLDKLHTVRAQYYELFVCSHFIAGYTRLNQPDLLA